MKRFRKRERLVGTRRVCERERESNRKEERVRVCERDREKESEDKIRRRGGKRKEEPTDVE